MKNDAVWILTAAGRALAGLLVLTAAGPVSAGPHTAGPLTQISGLSPFGALGNCGNFPDGGQNFTNSEVEPWVVVNPTNADNIIAFYQQDRWSNGGARSTVASVSLDGGTTWQVVDPPGLTDCSFGPFDRASDPWLSFAPDGTVYAMSLLFDVPPAVERNAMGVSQSFDGGLTWGPVQLLIDNIDPPFFNDKNSLTADPNNASFAYATWDRLRSIGFNFEGPIVIARTTNGGASWNPAVEVYNPGTNNQTLGNQIVVRPAGQVFNFFNEIINFLPSGGFNPNPDVLAFLLSTDNGATWRPTGGSRRVVRMFPAEVATPDTGDPVRDAASLFDVAVDPNNGNLYAVWQDRRFTGFDQIAYIQSTDGGRSWSPPIMVNRTPPTPANPLRRQAFLPSVAVSDDGTVAVSYYDFRNDGPLGELADFWLVHCHANCSNPASWADEVRLTDASFNYLDAPQANGLFLGDYMGLDAQGVDFVSVFQQAAPGADKANGFFRRVGH